MQKSTSNIQYELLHLIFLLKLFYERCYANESEGYLLIENIIKVFLYIDGIYKAVPIRVVHLSKGQLCFSFSCSFEVAYVLRKHYQNLF
ncbi:hypothetical protein T10_280 [Trichinella papuae]|uniref:Uncharacterized protein n=1 Tax=Trichinella papuae TaxID=268474 RepID=A0A0V1MQB3_9BILA|nr:hypothetical protein T10_280 [Trichinella papuae]